MKLWPLFAIFYSTFAFADLQPASQMLWVKSSSTPKSVARMYSLEKGKWIPIGSEFPVVVGRNGTTADKFEGDGKTPEGVFPLTQSFGVSNRTDIKLSYTQLTADDKWIDDPAHADYNKWIRGATTAKSYETLLRKDNLYNLFFVVGYNMLPIVSGKGSAIFVHLWSASDKGTAGCVAMDPAQIEVFGRWLDPAKNPQIQVGGSIN
jgi:L,D-peptidoglycan transpeptidase YkuD (ErfK/YbiS/YcfS/YnhG family)